jgi:hypothetical protein
VSGLFLAALAFLFWIRTKLPVVSLQDLHWTLLIAVLLLLPFLLPIQDSALDRTVTILGRAGKVLQTVKIGNVELTLRDSYVALTVPLDIAQIQAADVLTPTDAMTLIERANALNKEGAEVVRVHLGVSDNVWKLPNLYFFATLLAERTGVRQLVFTKAIDDRPDVFVEMCPPEVLCQAIAKADPFYGQAPAIVSGKSLEENFKDLKSRIPPASQDRVSAGRLNSILNGALHRSCRIEDRDPLGQEDVRRVLQCRESFVAVTRDGDFTRVLDQRQVALDVARRVDALRT